MKALDLFCGIGGASVGLHAVGFECIGIDLFPQPRYPFEFIQADAMLPPVDLRGFDFIWASPPCQQFAVFDLQMFHPHPKHPVLGIQLFESTRRMLEASGVPHVIENVRAAQKFVGPSIQHCGPFHLWGSAVPALFPYSAFRVRKGLTFNHRGGIKGSRALGPGEKRASKAAADSAAIPPEIAEHIGSIIAQGRHAG